MSRVVLQRPVPPPSSSAFMKPAHGSPQLETHSARNNIHSQNPPHFDVTSYEKPAVADGEKQRFDSVDSSTFCGILAPEALEKHSQLLDDSPPRQLKKPQTTEAGVVPGDSKLDNTPVRQLQAKQKLEVIGKLPSYSTACQMTQYSPQPEHVAQFSFANQNPLNRHDDKATSMRRIRLQKTSSFDTDSNQAELLSQSTQLRHNPGTGPSTEPPRSSPPDEASLSANTLTSWSDKSSTAQVPPQVVNSSVAAASRDVTSSRCAGSNQSDTHSTMPAGDCGLSAAAEVCVGHDDRCARDCVTDDEARAESPAQSVYDNVHCVWQPKSGSELRHFHF